MGSLACNLPNHGVNLCSNHPADLPCLGSTNYNEIVLESIKYVTGFDKTKLPHIQACG